MENCEKLVNIVIYRWQNFWLLILIYKNCENLVKKLVSNLISENHWKHLIKLAKTDKLLVKTGKLFVATCKLLVKTGKLFVATCKLLVKTGNYSWKQQIIRENWQITCKNW